MRVLILGGYGVFGGRLARLFQQDGVEVIVAARDKQRAEAFAREFGAAALSVRRVYVIGAPDLKLFPKAFGAHTVIFRAGLELSLMHRSLNLLGQLRARGLLPNLTAFLNPILRVSERLEPFGSDRGAMAVDVTGVLQGQTARRRWQVIAYKGDGPFIPAVPALAIIRKFEAIQPGARRCLFELSLADIENAMSSLSVDFSRQLLGCR